MQLLQADHSVSKPPYAAVNSKEKGSRKRNINLTLDYIGLGQKHSLVGLSNLLRRDINRIDKCANKQGCLRNQSVSESPHHLAMRIISVTLLGNGNHPSVFSLGFFFIFYEHPSIFFDGERLSECKKSCPRKQHRDLARA